MGFSREKPDFAQVRQKILAFHPLSKVYGVFPASPISFIELDLNITVVAIMFLGAENA